MTLFQLASRFIGVREITGEKDNPLIVWMSQLSNPQTQDDETPWCSAFVNAMCWILGLPRSRSNAARSWLKIGTPIPIMDARQGDIVVLKRGGGEQPGPEIIDAPGHVGILADLRVSSGMLHILAGNQSNEVNIQLFPVDRVLGIRRV